MTNHTSHDVDAVPARIEATIRTVVADSRSRIREVTIVDCETVEVDSYLEGVKDEDSLTQSDEEDDDLLLKRLQQSVLKGERQAWMREADDLLLKAGITEGSAQAREAFDDGLSPTEFLLDFLGTAQ